MPLSKLLFREDFQCIGCQVPPRVSVAYSRVLVLLSANLERLWAATADNLPANPGLGEHAAELGVYSGYPKSQLVLHRRSLADGITNFHLSPAERWEQWNGRHQVREGAMKQTFATGIGGAAGQGVATPGDIFAKIFSRRGLHLNAYNAYQSIIRGSIIRGGHTLLTIRAGTEKVTNMGDRIDLLIPLNQDTMDRHLRLLTAGAACIYNSDTIKPGAAASGVQLCSLPVSELADITRNKVAQNTLAPRRGPLVH
jgi:hypothetical protein